MATQCSSREYSSQKYSSKERFSEYTSKRLAKIITTFGAALVTITLGSYSWATPKERPLFAKSGVDTEDIDYRHMSLYNLKQRRYHNVDADDEQITVNHVHHHEHWGWAGGLGGWDSPCYHHGCDNRWLSFGQRVSDGVTSAAVTASVLAIAMGTIYGLSRAASLFWPYVGGAGLTAIELAADSPWVITGYRVANGYAVREQDFAHNPDALSTVKDEQMFDPEFNPAGRFLLLDQENWWGLTDYPLDTEITFSKYDANDELVGDITVQLQRSVTNGVKPGSAHVTLLKGSRHTEDTGTSYRVVYWEFYPAWLAFNQWYHQPNRIVFRIESVQQSSADLIDKQNQSTASAGGPTRWTRMSDHPQRNNPGNTRSI